MPGISAEGPRAQAVVRRRQYRGTRRRSRRACDDVTAIVGYVERNTRTRSAARCTTAVAVLRDGKVVVSRHFKTLLPTYDVFDESRYFEPGRGRRAKPDRRDRRREGRPFSICEDLWNDERYLSRRLYHLNPMADLDAAGAELMVNCSASPFVIDKQEFRVKLISRHRAAVRQPDRLRESGRRKRRARLRWQQRRRRIGRQDSRAREGIRGRFNRR